jgi:hypothetical protein
MVCTQIPNAIGELTKGPAAHSPPCPQSYVAPRLLNQPICYMALLSVERFRQAGKAVLERGIKRVRFRDRVSFIRVTSGKPRNNLVNAVDPRLQNLNIVSR